MVRPRSRVQDLGCGERARGGGGGRERELQATETLALSPGSRVLWFSIHLCCRPLARDCWADGSNEIRF